MGKNIPRNQPSWYILCFESIQCFTSRSSMVYLSALEAVEVYVLMHFTLLSVQHCSYLPSSHQSACSSVCSQPSFSGHILREGQSAMVIIGLLLVTAQPRSLSRDHCTQDQDDQYTLPSHHSSVWSPGVKFAKVLYSLCSKFIHTWLTSLCFLCHSFCICQILCNYLHLLCHSCLRPVLIR